MSVQQNSGLTPKERDEQKATAEIERWWKKEEQGDGSFLYLDPIGGCWLTMDEAVRNKVGRMNFHRVMGDYDDNRAADAYERQLQRDDRRV